MQFFCAHTTIKTRTMAIIFLVHLLATVGQSDKIVVERSCSIVRNIFHTFGSTIADGVWGCTKDISEGEHQFTFKHRGKIMTMEWQIISSLSFFSSSCDYLTIIVSWNWIWDTWGNSESVAGVAHNNENVSHVSDGMQRGGKEITNCWKSTDQTTADCTKRKIRS